VDKSPCPSLLGTESTNSSLIRSLYSLNQENSYRRRKRKNVSELNFLSQDIHHFGEHDERGDPFVLLGLWLYSSPDAMIHMDFTRWGETGFINTDSILVIDLQKPNESLIKASILQMETTVSTLSPNLVGETAEDSFKFQVSITPSTPSNGRRISSIFLQFHWIKIHQSTFFSFLFCCSPFVFFFLFFSIPLFFSFCFSFIELDLNVLFQEYP